MPLRDLGTYLVVHVGQDRLAGRAYLGANKLKALTDQAPADYIRLIRLKRAAQLLSEGQYNISEISDMTGFNDVKYFREVFKKYYKISPSGYSKGEMKEEPTKP